MKTMSAFALVSCFVLAACAGTSTSEGEPSTTAASNATTGTTSASITLDAKVARIIHLPSGEVAGLALADGTMVRLHPKAVTAAMSALKVGDSIHVEGDNAKHGTGLVNTTITKDGMVLAQRTNQPENGGPEQHGPHGFGPGGPGGPMGGPPPNGKNPFENLATVSRTAKVTDVDADHRGRAHGLTLEDGTTVYLPPFAKLTVKAGDVVAVTGKGGEYAGGAAIAAQSIKIGSADAVTFTPPTPPATVTRDGTVERVLANPHGDVDALLLDDGTVVELGPMTSAPAVIGSKVSLEGHALGTSFHAKTLTVDGKAVDLNALRPARPEHADGAKRQGPPSLENLTALERTAKIRAVASGPDGDVHRVILEDGTAVHVPPFAGDTSGLTVGQSITVKGRGTEGKLGTAMFAQSLTVDGKELITMPQHEGPADAR